MSKPQTEYRRIKSESQPFFSHLLLVLLFLTVQQSSGSLQELNDVTDGSVGFVIGGFKLAVGSELRVGLVMKQTVGQGATQVLVE